MRALAVGRWDASVCMSDPRFAPVDCGAVAAVAVEPSNRHHCVCNETLGATLVLRKRQVRLINDKSAIVVVIYLC